MKLLVETPGDFMLVLLRQEVPHHRPAVVNSTQQVHAQVSIGQLRVLYELPDQAHDTEFADWWAECGNRDLALKSYKSKFEPVSDQPDLELEPKTKKRGG